MATRINPGTGLEERFEYFGAFPDRKLARLALVPSRSSGVVFAGPISTDRGLMARIRDLSALLGGAGHSVLRFDYRGFGQSFGRRSELELETMAHDVTDAVGWLHEVLDTKNIAFLGVGLGATAVAMSPLADGRPLAIWDHGAPDSAAIHALAVAKLESDMGFHTDPSRPDDTLIDRVADDLLDDEFAEHGYFDAAGLKVSTALRDSAARHNLSDELMRSPRPLLASPDTSRLLDGLEPTIELMSRRSGSDVRDTADWLDRHLRSGDGRHP